MQIIVKLKLEDLLYLYNMGPVTLGAINFIEKIGQLGVMLEPLYPGSTDYELMSYFIIDAPYYTSPENIVALLKSCSSVEGIYIKPQGEMP